MMEIFFESVSDIIFFSSLTLNVPAFLSLLLSGLLCRMHVYTPLNTPCLYVFSDEVANTDLGCHPLVRETSVLTITLTKHK